MQTIHQIMRSKWFGPALLVLCFVFLLVVRVRIDLPTFGDEPHYLLMDYSLVHDHDLNLKNNYANRDYASFFPDDLQPQGKPDPNNVRSIHGDGLPVLLVPGFAIAGKRGAAMEMVAIATLTVWLTAVWVQILTKNRRLAFLTAGALAVCYFFSNLAGYIYPDMVIGAIVLTTLIVIEKFYKHPACQLLFGALLGFVVLVHFRALIFSLPMLAILCYKLWRAERRLPWMAFAGFAIFGVYYYWETYIGHTSNAPTVGSSGGSLTGDWFIHASAMLFDSNKGLLIFNPILWLLIVGLPIWWRAHRESLIITVIALTPTIATTAMFIEWHGGYAPTGRYMMSVLPAFMPALAFALSKITETWQKWVVGILGAATVFVTLDAMRTHYPLIDPNTWTRSPLFGHVQHITGLAFDKVLPAFVTTLPNLGDKTILLGHYGWVKLAACYLGLIALGVYGYMLSRPVARRRQR